MTRNHALFEEMAREARRRWKTLRASAEARGAAAQTNRFDEIAARLDAGHWASQCMAAGRTLCEATAHLERATRGPDRGMAGGTSIDR